MGASDTSVYEPILIRPLEPQNDTPLPRFYGGFVQQKQKWQSIDQRSHRLRYIAYAQLFLGLLSPWNYLWPSNIFSCFVGFVGILAFRSDKLSWTLVYLLVCLMEFMRHVFLVPHLYERYCIPHYKFSGYEYLQVLVMMIQSTFLIPAAFVVVFAAAANVANPLW
ncbi:hypothetical protein Poli38472_001632 [Pythium oligandrum]|uniref:Uncharacterized protein n=1 Tax=Pythium oligandrum TaxID=41045 RepID=A0A8K1CVP8_PYTOL|nr:hypothetical protein Poli38472_001632 [Pythium oligandrum]|eukprot:TMW69476.1 hypothetical protein Poli38472_001632 [Pythium oligandrum]